MRYIMFCASTDFKTRRVHVETNELYSFEEMMQLFTFCIESRDNVMVIEPDTKKVVCHYKSDGNVLFNKALLDGAIYVNESEQGVK